MAVSSRQQNRGVPLSAMLAMLVLAFALSGAVDPSPAATTERVVVDRHTGLAIGGFDPVAYFTDADAREGSAEHEYYTQGATWRFRNPGNLGAFAADPQVYAPQFGGYDPAGVARGVAAPGHPQIWLIRDKRLYLFQSEEAREAFVSNSPSILNAAQERWPAVLHSLVP